MTKQHSLIIESGTPKSVYSKTWLEPDLKEFIQNLAIERGQKESQLIRWALLRGLNTVPGIEIWETGAMEK